VEAGLLFQLHPTERFRVFGELVDWQAIDEAVVDVPGSPFDGQPFRANVLRYGIGASYDFCPGTYDLRVPRIAGVCELVGWTVLDGLKSEIQREPFFDITPLDASGDTIVNLKLGTRVDWARRSSVYAGYGFALTDDHWYRHMLRVEYRFSF
jgi:hypothetical protein